MVSYPASEMKIETQSASTIAKPGSETAGRVTQSGSISPQLHHQDRMAIRQGFLVSHACMQVYKSLARMLYMR